MCRTQYKNKTKLRGETTKQFSENEVKYLVCRHENLFFWDGQHQTVVVFARFTSAHFVEL